MFIFAFESIFDTWQKHNANIGYIENNEKYRKIIQKKLEDQTDQINRMLDIIVERNKKCKK
jgi:hypothetical protein